MPDEMKRKTWKFVFLTCFIVFIYYFLLKANSTKRLSKDIYHSSSIRAAIVTLTRGDSIRLINMLHSIEYFYPESIGKYPMIIFYDPHGNEMQNFNIDYIKSCVKLKLIFQKIVLFKLIKNPTETIEKINQEKSRFHQRPINYRLMCLFWSHTVFYHPLIKNNYDYIMRLDDDSYFLEKFNFDLFQYIHENNLDYIYRAFSWDMPLAGPDDLLPKYLNNYHKTCQSNCFPFHSYDSVYNNFFLTRLQFWYQTKIEEFIHNLLLNDTILIYSLGDGNIHAVILALASDTKHTEKLNFAYAHNIHIYGKRNKNFDLQHNYHNWFDILANNSKNACRQLIIIEPIKKQLKYIQL